MYLNGYGRELTEDELNGLFKSIGKIAKKVGKVTLKVGKVAAVGYAASMGIPLPGLLPGFGGGGGGGTQPAVDPSNNPQVAMNSAAVAQYDPAQIQALQQYQMQQQSGNSLSNLPSWVLPASIGGGFLMLMLMMQRRD